MKSASTGPIDDSELKFDSNDEQLGKDDFSLDSEDYFNFKSQIEKYPVFSKEEERERFIKLKGLQNQISDVLDCLEKSPNDQELKAALKKLNAKKKILVEDIANHNYGLVIKLAIHENKHKCSPHILFMDIVQDGAIGLLRAIERFDVDLEYRFSTYAVNWIKQGIQNGMAEFGTPLGSMPVHQFSKAKKVFAIRNMLQNKLGREPTVEEIASKGKLSAKVTKNLLDSAPTVASLNADVKFGAAITSTSNENVSLESAIPDKKLPDMEENYIRKQEAAKVYRFAKELLNDKTYEIFICRNMYDPPEKYEDIANRIGVSRETVRQLDLQSKRLIRYCLEHGHLPASGQGNQQN